MKFLTTVLAAATLTVGFSSYSSATTVTSIFGNGMDYAFESNVARSNSVQIMNDTTFLSSFGYVDTRNNRTSNHQHISLRDIFEYSYRKSDHSRTGSHAFWNTHDGSKLLSLFMNGEAYHAFKGHDFSFSHNDDWDKMAASVRDKLFEWKHKTKPSYDTDKPETELTPVPLPAAGILLVLAVGGLGGFGAMRRRSAA